MFAVIRMELSGKTVYGPVLKTTQLSALNWRRAVLSADAGLLVHFQILHILVITALASPVDAILVTLLYHTSYSQQRNLPDNIFHLPLEVGFHHSQRPYQNHPHLDS